MEKDHDLAADKPRPKAISHKHTLLWILVGLFVVASIGAMFAIDYFYAADPDDAATAVKAVDE